MKKFIWLLSILLMAVTGDAAHSQGKLYQIVAAHSNGCLAVAGASGSRSQVVHMPGCEDSRHFAFYPEKLRNGYYRIRPAHSDGCLAVAGASRGRSGIVQIPKSKCEFSDHFQFLFQSVGNGFYKIRTAHTGGCVAVAGASRGRSEMVHLPGCEITDHFKFYLRPYYSRY